jgi:hypothetical protein
MELMELMDHRVQVDLRVLQEQVVVQDLQVHQAQVDLVVVPVQVVHLV